MTKKIKKPIFIVGIGSSAGGLEALSKLLRKVNPGSNLVFIIAQHMSPHHQSMLTELLSRECTLNVCEAKNGSLLTGDTVYVNPPNHDVFVEDNRIVLKELEHTVGPKPSVDNLFVSLATAYKDKANGIILSGTGSDGAHGCRAIRAAGGITIAQEPSTAKYDGMPTAAIRSGSIDLILSPEDIAAQLPEIVKAPREKVTVTTQKAHSSDTFEELINLIFQATNVDFGHYKQATLTRQLQRRLVALQLASLEGYFKYIDKNPEELHIIQRCFLISVTQFFRDEKVFDQLKGQIAHIIKNKPLHGTMRIWVPACATGEEVYSLAILVKETLGRNTTNLDIKIFGTDIDNAATESARLGLYSPASVEGIDKDILNRYFVAQGRHYQVIKSVREMCVFAHHNLVQDPPFLKMDVISCRNLLIYFDNELQEKIINNFHYSLNPKGMMILGKSESIGPVGESLFNKLNDDDKIFFRREGSYSKVIISNRLSTGKSIHLNTNKNRVISPKKQKKDAMDLCLLEAYGPPSVLINQALEPVQFFGKLDEFMSLPDGAADFSILSLTPSYLRTELRALLNRARNSDEAVHKHNSRNIKLTVRKLYINDTSETFLLLSFEKPEQIQHMADGVEISRDHHEHINQLENALAGAQEHLQAVIEELETSNEELQSLNEELQASTEELQSSNEELETTNEELQATNEELTTLNDELRAKSAELNEANNTLANVQNSIDMGLIVLDKKLRLLRYTPRVVRLFGILPDDIGQKITSLAAHTDIANFEAILNAVINSGNSQTIEINRRNETFLMNISPFIIEDTLDVSGVVLTFSDITELTLARKSIALAEKKFREIFDNSAVGIAVSGKGGIINDPNPFFCQWLGYKPEEIIGKHFADITHPDDVNIDVNMFKSLITGERDHYSLEKRYIKKNGECVHGLLNVSCINIVDNTDSSDVFVIAIIQDIGEQVRSRAMIYEQSNFDSLTELPNRTLLKDRLSQMIDYADPETDSIYVLFLDIDKFKEVNDSSGHEAGDLLLKTVADKLKSIIPKGCTASRFGGDEFVIILGGNMNELTARAIAEEILAECAVPISTENYEFSIAVSIGIASFPQESHDPVQLIQYADTAMYEAKNTGGNTFKFFSPEMNDKVMQQLEIKADLRVALANNELELYYQPLYRANDKKMVTAEALIRWRHSTKGIIMPGKFIPIAEKSELIEKVDLWVFKTASEFMLSNKLSIDYISINITGRTLISEEFIELAQSFSKVASRICIEITERTLYDDKELFLARLKQLKQLNYLISIDDFGIGYSNLNGLISFPIDIIKIDKSFTDTVTQHQSFYPVIDAIYSIADSMKAGVVIEGIETSSQVRYFENKKSTILQGFYFSKPLAKNEFLALFTLY